MTKKKNCSSNERLVILDSSMLMIPLERKINLSFQLEKILFFAFKIVVPTVVIKELKKHIDKKKTATRNKAKLALKLAEQYETIDSNTEIHTDDELINLAEKHNAIIATNDNELRDRLRKEGFMTIGVRGKKTLELFGIDKQSKYNDEDE